MQVPLTLGKRAVALTASVVLCLAAFAQDAGAQLTVRTDDTVGDHLVDGADRTLYLFTNDTDGASACYDQCAVNWPPLLADGEVGSAEGIDPGLVGITERTDGTVQVTYAGWPLYTFIGDTEPGATVGQAVNDVWFVVAPDGTGIDAPDAAAGSDDFAALMDEGAAVFAYICATCHGAQGDEQLASHVVVLAGNSRLENERLILRRVVHGGGYMPGFGGDLSDREVAAVATYVRNSFGNEYGVVREEAATETR